MGAALLRRELHRRDPEVVVASAGVLTRDGNPATAGTVSAARDFGIDLHGHRSQAATRDVIAASDLLLGMERMHVREVVVLDPRAFSRSFTLKELVRRGEERGPRQAGESQAEWLAAVHHGRTPNGLLGASGDDDVADPTNDWSVDHGVMASEVDDLVARIVGLLWPNGVE
jgi:protein-tyrosine phosphatase